MVHVQEMVWCLAGLTELCGVKLSLRSELCALCVIVWNLVLWFGFFYGGSAGRAVRAGSEACATWWIGLEFGIWNFVGIWFLEFGISQGVGGRT